MHKYIHSGEIEELADVIPYEDFIDYTAEDFIQDHATVTADEDNVPDQNQNEYDDGDDSEPSSKRLKNDYDSFENDGSNDYDMRYGPGIPSLLNLNLQPPRRGQEDKNVPEKSPVNISPWDSSNFNNGSFGSNQNSNNKGEPSNKDRRESRRQGSRWSSSRR